MNIEAEIAELRSRIELLEGEGTESLQPNFITINPATGITGANFAGTVHAQGLNLDAATNSTPPDQDKIRWLRVSDGGVVASIAAYELPLPIDTMTVQAGGGSTSKASLVLSALSSSSASILSIVDHAIIPTHSALQLSLAGGVTSTLIDETGAGILVLDITARVNRTAALATVTPAITKILYDTVDFDVCPTFISATGLSWDTVNQNFICRKAGRYLVLGAVAVTATAVGQFINAYVFKNGVQVSETGEQVAAAATEQMVAPVQDIVNCALNDTLDIRYSCGTAGLAFNTGTLRNYACFASI